MRLHMTISTYRRYPLKPNIDEISVDLVNIDVKLIFPALFSISLTFLAPIHQISKLSVTI